MLINVRSDKQFQRFLDRREQELHLQMVPIIGQAIRLTIARGGHNAQEQMVRRGEKVLAAHYRRIFREVYGSVNRARLPTRSAKSIPENIRKQGEDDYDTEDINDFMSAQLGYIQREAARSITRISHSLIDDIRNIVFGGVQEGWSSDKIAREIAGDIPDMSRTRAATIARTETHGAATWAMDETIDYKQIEIATKRWWANLDTRVRDSHRAMHDVAIPRDQPFQLDGGDLMFPGDDSLGADPGEIINCRCVCLYETAAGPAEEGAEKL